MRPPLVTTRLTQLFGIRHPLFCGGLIWLADARYVAAVVNAGGMGFITALSFPDPEEFRKQIQLCRELTQGKPFGVNLSVSRRPGVNERIRPHIDVVIQENVRFIETSGSNPVELLPRLKDIGCIVMHKVPYLKYAESAVRSGVDAISVVGGEAGGHPGPLLMGTMVQAGLGAERIDVPWAIGGGIGSGRQLIAALAMGADGVLLGSRMLAAREIWAHEDYKRQIIAGDGTESRIRMTVFRDHHRVLDNETSRSVAGLEAQGITDFEQYRSHVDGRLARHAYETGEIERGMIDYGQSVAYVDKSESVEEIFDQMIDDAARALRRLRDPALSPLDETPSD